MITEFYCGSKHLEQCDQAAIPRRGDSVVINELKYHVYEVVWDYDMRRIYIYVDPVGDLAGYMEEDD